MANDQKYVPTGRKLAPMELVASLEARFKLLTFLKALGPAAFALFLQFVTFTVTARGLGVEAFGAYTAILALTGVGVEMVGFGGADLLVRAVAHGRERFPRYFGNMLLLIAVSMPPVVILSTFIVKGLLDSSISWGLVVAAVAGEILIGRIAASLELVMVAHHQSARASVVRSATAATRLIVAVIYFLLLGRSELSGWIIFVLVQSAGLSSIYLLAGSRLYGRPSFVFLTPEIYAGSAFAVNKIAGAAQNNLDRLILSSFAADYVLGIYGAASRVLQLGLFPVQVVTRIIYPKYFEHGRNGVAATRRYALSILPMVIGVGVVSGVGIAIAALFVPSILGSAFSQSSGVAARLAFAMPLIALQYPPGDILSGTGHQSLRAGISVVTSCLFGFLLILGVRAAGQDGVVYAYIIGQLAIAAVLWVAVFLVKDKVVLLEAPGE